MNHIPNDEEIRFIKLHVINPCVKQLEELDTDIASLKAQLQALEQKRDALSDHIDRHRAFISSIRRLPHDILKEIFIQFLPTEHFALMKTGEAPLHLGRICSSWRQVSLTTPQLWSSIHIPYTEKFRRTSSTKAKFKRDCKSRLKGISAWLSRTGVLPLSISCYVLITKNLRVRENPPFISDLFNLLLTVRNRWKHVQLSGPNELEHLKLILTYGSEVAEQPIKCFFAALTHLETLTLVFSSPPAAILVEGLRSLTALTELTLENEDTPLNGPIIALDDIRELITGLVAIGSPTKPPILPCLESFTHFNSILHDHHYKPLLLSRTRAKDNSTSSINTTGVTPLKRAHLTFERCKMIDLLNDPELSAARIASGLDLTVKYPMIHDPQFNAGLGLAVKEDNTHSATTRVDVDDPGRWAISGEMTDAESD
ncbi:hypothetical protein AX16_005440 [Volvariella volvacea WC 439]|nr:hypothetical protein AX16_005440 [Volvariella volvacea WC 439]